MTRRTIVTCDGCSRQLDHNEPYRQVLFTVPETQRTLPGEDYCNRPACRDKIAKALAGSLLEVRVFVSTAWNPEAPQ